jgi:hypothetical protein
MRSRPCSTSLSVVPCSPSPAPPRYLLDGKPVTLQELLEVNDFGGDEVVAIRNLPVGESLNLGGGVAGTFVLTRLPAGEVSP